MKKRNKILVGAAIVTCMLGFAFGLECSHYWGLPPYLQKPNVREKVHQHLTTLGRTGYSQQKVKIGDRRYTLTVKKIEPWAHVKKGLGLEIKNFETGDKISVIDEDDTIYYSEGGVGGAFYAEKPKFRSINKISVNGELQETNKQREKEINEFFKPLEKDLEGLANAKIRRQEIAWNLARGIKSDFVEICSVEYIHPKSQGAPCPKGQFSECPDWKVGRYNHNRRGRSTRLPPSPNQQEWRDLHTHLSPDPSWPKCKNMR